MNGNRGHGIALAAPGVLTPLLDALLPPTRALAVGRVRNYAVLGALVAYLVPKTELVGGAPPERVHGTAAAFAVAAVLAHFVRRRSWGTWAAGAAIVLPVALAGVPGRPWAAGIAAISLLTLLAASLRARDDEGDDDALSASPRGLAGIAWSIVGVLVFREFAVLPIHVPTGSMQPTIYGARPGPPPASGDHIAVDRVRYLRGDPQRWDVAVFDFPLHRPTEFVKRVVGLPGETVSIRDGDVWIDGRIAQKPPLVQDALWQQAFPKPHPRGQAKSLAAGWHAASGAAGRGWALEGDVIRCDAKGGGERVLQFTPKLSHGDVRVRMRVELEPGREGDLFAVRIRSRGSVVEFRTSGDGGALATAVSVDGRRAAAGDGVPDEFRVLDGVASAWSEGREIVRAEVATDGTHRHGLELAAMSPVRFHAPRVDQDLVHLPAQDGTSTWHVPPGHWFVLGDNARSSEDSREWRVTELRVRGRAEPFRAPVSYPGETGMPVTNLRRDGDAYVFADVDGLPRRVAVADVERRTDGVPAPFVPRGHFLGRAALIFWPWVPAEGGFRPRLLP